MTNLGKLKEVLSSVHISTNAQNTLMYAHPCEENRVFSEINSLIVFYKSMGYDDKDLSLSIKTETSYGTLCVCGQVSNRHTSKDFSVDIDTDVSIEKSRGENSCLEKLNEIKESILNNKTTYKHK